MSDFERSYYYRQSGIRPRYKGMQDAGLVALPGSPIWDSLRPVAVTEDSGQTGSDEPAAQDVEAPKPPVPPTPGQTPPESL